MKTRVLALAALASAEGGQDPVDAAVRTAAALHKTSTNPPKAFNFVPFDPATKMSEAPMIGPDGNALRIVKGAFAVIHGLSQLPLKRNLPPTNWNGLVIAFSVPQSEPMELCASPEWWR